MAESRTFELVADKGRITVKIVVEEVIDEQNGTSQLVVSSLEAKSSKWYGVTYFIDGVISVNSYNLQSFSKSAEQYYLYWDALDKFSPVRVQKSGTNVPWKSLPLEAETAKLSVKIHGYSINGKYDSGWYVDGEFEIPLSHGDSIISVRDDIITSFKFKDYTAMAFLNGKAVVMTVKHGVLAEDNAVLGYAVLGTMKLGNGG